MNPTPQPNQENANPLHLGKFAPDQPDQPQSTDPDGPTVFFRRVAADVAKQSGQPVVAPKEGNAMAGKDLLGAVAYCYAKGVYSASDIEAQMLHNPELRQATHDGIPDANAIRRFRRVNRGAILETLEKWYRKLRKSKPTTEVMPGAQPPEPVAVRPSPVMSPPDENTSIFVKREASARLDKAAFIDNMEKD